MEDEWVLALNRPESKLTHPPGHIWRDKWTALTGPLSYYMIYWLIHLVSNRADLGLLLRILDLLPLLLYHSLA